MRMDAGRREDAALEVEGARKEVGGAAGAVAAAVVVVVLDSGKTPLPVLPSLAVSKPLRSWSSSSSVCACVCVSYGVSE
jgi:hypothetical protein